MLERNRSARDDEARRRIEIAKDPIAMLQAVAARAPMRDAIVHLRDFRDLSPIVFRYGKAADTAARFAAALTAFGITADDVVAIIAPSIPEMLLALAGAAGVAIAFPINHSLSAESMASQFALSKARVLVTFGQHPAMPLHRVVAEAARLAGVGLVIEIETEYGPSDELMDCAPRLVGWSDFLERSDPSDVRPVRGDRAAFLFHTGGTTGAPKLAELSLAAAMAALHTSAVGFGWRDVDRVLQLLPFFHVGGAFSVGTELLVRGPMLFRGYRTVEGLVSAPGDGWYASGDLGEVLSDGQLRLVGRAKDVIIRSGHNIDPLAIEDVVCRHPAIVMAASVGMPDAFAGELPIVYAVRKADLPVEEEEIAAFVAQRIDDPAARPKRFIFLDSLPLTQVGKVARYRLRQAAAILRVSELLSEFAGDPM
jgi:acyl-coenzyme A synthetase/AMP-(fatty) acid ligase